MPNPAEVADVANRWRPLSDAEKIVAATRLEDAWRIVLNRFPDIETRMAAYDPSGDPPVTDLDPQVVIGVLADMVLRVLKNPEGKRQESIDDYSYLRDNALSAGELYLSDNEIDRLGGPGATSNAFTIHPYGVPGYATTAPDWWEGWQNA